MALVDTTWYVNFGDGSTTGHYAVAKRPQNTAVAAGQLVRQFTAPTVTQERVYVCIVAGTTANTTDATWTITRGAKVTDGTATWQECTGQAALNGDLTNTATWAQVKAATPAVLGQIIKRSNNASYQICTTAGAMSASEPTFSDTAGVTTTDTTAVWTSLGAVGNFTGGQAPWPRLFTVFQATTWFSNNGTIYVGDNHNETVTGNLSNVVCPAQVARVICHNHSGSYPPTASDMMTGASVALTGFIQLYASGAFYFYGITLKGNLVLGASVATSPNWLYFDNCLLWALTGVNINLGYSGGAGSWQNVVLNNTQVKFDSAASFIAPSGVILNWRNSSAPVLASGSFVPTTLIAFGTVPISTITLEALDLSQLTGSLFTNVGASSLGSITIKDCKLNASATVTQPINTGQSVQLSRSDSGATAYKSSRSTYEGVESTETSIVRTGGYVDPNAQTQSRKIVTSANSQWLRPYKSQALAVWNGAVGSSKTVTVYGTVNAGALPNNDDIWMEVNYLGDASFSNGTTATSGKAQVWSANAAGSSDGSSWGGGGSGAGWSPFKLTVNITPQLPGYIIPTIKAAKASTTFYIDPAVVVT